MNLNIPSDKTVLSNYKKKTQKMLTEHQKKIGGKLMIAIIEHIAIHYNGISADWTNIGDKRIQEYIRTQT